MTCKEFIKKSLLFFPRRIKKYFINPICNLKRKCLLKQDKLRLHNAFENNLYKDLACIEEQRLRSILVWAKHHSKYYKDILKEFYTNNVLSTQKKMPLLTRNVLIEKGEEIKVDNISWIPHFQLSTSGTTGMPLKFIRCPDYEWSHQIFLYEYMTGLTKIDLSKIISFGGMYLDESLTKKNIFWSKRTPTNIYGYCHFSSFYLNKKNIGFYVDEIERQQPYIIRSYPSCLILFIDLCKEMNIMPKLDVKGIYVTSENVTKDQMDKIADFFRCGCYGQYGHSEACVFAFTKKNDTKYYCSPLYGYVEVVDNYGNHVKEGEIGQVCVTSFTNRAQPFIRYITGDLAEYGGRYNGFVVFNKLLGRSQDFVLNADNEKLFIIVGEFSECFLPAINNVKYWQAEQNEIGKMHLRIVKKDCFTKNDEKEIIDIMLRSKMQTIIEYVDDIPLTKAGKRKYIIQNIKL